MYVCMCVRVYMCVDLSIYLYLFLLSGLPFRMNPISRYLYLSIYGIVFPTLQLPSDHGVLATTLEEL